MPKLSNIVLSVFFLTAAVFSQEKVVEKPNILLIMLDDVSPDIYGCYGQPTAAQTPNVDKLASEGVMFKTCYASAMCGPSRVEIMTGKYGSSTGVLENGMWLGDSKSKVYGDYQAFGKLLSDAGYATAIAGKWHAGSKMPYEEEIGFQEYCLWESLKEIEETTGQSWTGGMEDASTTSRYWHPAIVKNGELLNTEASDFGPDIFADFIMDFMEQKTNENQPFLAYWPSVAPHGTRVGIPSNPFRGAIGDFGGGEVSAEEKTARFKSLNNYMDYLVGKVIQKINNLGIADNTIVIFTSDNGTAITAKTRGVERGCHVVNIIAGAGIEKRGATNELTDFTDIAPTLLDFAGGQLPAGKSFDGISLKPFLTGETETTKDWIYGFIATSQIVRTKNHMLEVVNPLLGVPKGRFYHTGDNRFGRGYEFVNGVEAHQDERARFDEFLKAHPAVLRDHEFWNTKQGIRFLADYDTPSSKEKHLYNHKDYKFYDEGPGLEDLLHLESTEIQGLNYYPNPVKDMFYLRAQSTIDEVCIYSVLGELLVCVTGGEFRVNLAEFESGTYIVRVTSNGVSKSFPLIKK